jgi:hypothetical protein
MSSEKVRPIKPSEIEDKKTATFPDAVFESFNEMIIKNYSGISATVKQKDVVKLMVDKGLNQKQIIDNHWLDVEPIYRKEGWHVKYDGPGYNESYEPYFVFSKKQRGSTRFNYLG